MNVRSTGLIRAFSGRIDSLTGADRLRPAIRRRMLAEQVQDVTQMAPVIAVAAMLISVLLMATTRNLPIFSSIVTWSAGLYLMMMVTMRRWFRDNGAVPPVADCDRELRSALTDSFFMGATWGALPMLVLPASSPQMVTTIGIVIAGVFCVTGFSLLILPQAAVMFGLPLMSGLLVGVLGLADPAQRYGLTALILVHVLVTALLCLRNARSRVAHLSSEQKVLEQNDIISLLLKEFEEHSSDWLWEFDRTGRLRRVSERFCIAAGLPRSDLAGRDFRELLARIARDNEAREALERIVERRDTFGGFELAVTVEGSERFWRVAGKPTYDEHGEFAGYIGTASDITDHKNAERRISFLAHYDALTGLLNRASFADRLEQAFSRLEREGTPFAVLCLDLDEFKAVNDSRGHPAGDRLLVDVAGRIRAGLTERDAAARLGGDEFAILLGCEAGEAGAVARRLVESVGRPYLLGQSEARIGVSIGIALAPANGTTPDQIMRNADLALYRAKAQGRGTYRFFETQAGPPEVPPFFLPVAGSIDNQPGFPASPPGTEGQ